MKSPNFMGNHMMSTAGGKVHPHNNNTSPDMDGSNMMDMRKSEMLRVMASKNNNLHYNLTANNNMLNGGGGNILYKPVGNNNNHMSNNNSDKDESMLIYNWSQNCGPNNMYANMQPTRNYGMSMDSSSSNETRDTFVRSDSILEDDYVPFEASTSSKYGPISRMSKASPYSTNSSLFNDSIISSDLKNWFDDSPNYGGHQEIASNSVFSENMEDYMKQMQKMKQKNRLIEMESHQERPNHAMVNEQKSFVDRFVNDKEQMSSPNSSYWDSGNDTFRTSQLWDKDSTLVNNGTLDIGELSSISVLTSDEDAGIANGIRELEQRLESELELKFN